MSAGDRCVKMNMASGKVRGNLENRRNGWDPSSTRKDVWWDKDHHSSLLLLVMLPPEECLLPCYCFYWCVVVVFIDSLPIPSCPRADKFT